MIIKIGLKRPSDLKPIPLGNSWNARLADQFQKPYMTELRSFLRKELDAGKVIYPPHDEVFAAFKLTPFEKVKVVIIGQDPYHGIGQAHGLCFSVKPGVAIPPSLRNIYQELYDDLRIKPPGHGYLQSWAEQGVLLLNSVLTVEQSRAAAHQKRGWETFTDTAMECLNRECSGIVFLLWGSYAQRKGEKIDTSRHCVITSTHPSPLSAYRGFLGSRPFSQANQYLKTQGKDPICWELPS